MKISELDPNTLSIEQIGKLLFGDILEDLDKGDSMIVLSIDDGR